MFTQIERHELYNQAIKQWGNNSQMDMCIEECAELIQAISKMKRPNRMAGQALKNLCEEIADVEIMLEQIRLIVHKDGLIDNIKDEKLEKLQKLLGC